MRETGKLALCSMITALGVVVMLLGAILGLGLYASPMIAGICLLPLEKEVGRKYQALVWLATGLICCMLISDMEQNLMYFALFGAYPLVRSRFEKMPLPWGWIARLAFFNLMAVGVEALALLVLAPESLSPMMIALLLILGNGLFVLYDRMIPRFERIMARYLSRITGRYRR